MSDTDQKPTNLTKDPEVMSSSFIMEKMKGVVKLKDEFSADQLKFIKGLINPDLTDSELYMFMALAGRLQLDPFNKEIIAVVYSKDKPEERKVNYIIPRDGKRVVAERQGGYESMETKAIYTKTTKFKVGTEQIGGKDVDVFDTRVDLVNPWEGGVLWGAVCTITRNGKTRTFELPLSEYNKAGQRGGDVWSQKPSTMIKKVAESQALSAMFPEILGGIYDDAEAISIVQPEKSIESGDTTPASEEQIETIKSMGGEIVDGMTKTQAAETIKSLVNTKK